MEEILKVEDLKSYYRSNNVVVKAVDGVSFDVKKNEIVGIVGESGCGKSTLALSTLGMARPPCYIEGGKVHFNGVDLLSLDSESQRKIRLTGISYIPQSSMNALNPTMRVEDQILDGAKAHQKMTSDEAKAMVQTQLEMVGLPATTAKMYPHELSGGMKQRAIIAVATALRPQLLIADEPTTALDVVVQRLVLEFLQETQKKWENSIILVTHDIAVQAEIVDRLIVMYGGRLLEISDIKHVFEDPLHPYTKSLIDATPSLDTKKPFISIPGLPPSLINPPPGCRFKERCPKSKEKCGGAEPGLREVEPGRFVACNQYGDA